MRISAVPVNIGRNGKGELVIKSREQDEKRSDFEAEAEARYARIIASGETVLWDDMRNYLKAKIAGKALLAQQKL